MPVASRSSQHPAEAARPGSGMKIAGLVLAAGGGSRFGRPKAEVTIGGRRMVDLAIDSCVGAGLSPVVVVLGAVWLTPMPRTAAPGHDVAEIWLVENTRWATGLASSLQAGLAALEGEPGVDAVVLTLVDTVSVGVDHLRRVGSAVRDGATAAVATYGGLPRTPAGLTREVWEEVAKTAEGDQGARVWLRSNPGRVTSVDCDDLGPWVDIDTPENLPG
ncbi:MAG: nucleotidyltransferase family protein [Dermatophilaceae bacterium]